MEFITNGGKVCFDSLICIFGNKNKINDMNIEQLNTLNLLIYNILFILENT